MSERTRIIISVAAAVAALLSFLLLFSLYSRYLHEQELYAATDGSAFAAILSEKTAELSEISEKRALDAKNSFLAQMAERVENRAERYNAQLHILVNPWNYVQEDYYPCLSTVDEGYLVHRRCAAALMRMLEDCRAAGNLPVICSAYRTQEYQQELYQNKINRLLAAGTPYEQAPSVAAMSVAIPGTSEHQLGLAVDIIDETYVNLDRWQEYTSVQQWLMAHCSDYGFILRYPNGSSEITGIIYEPWHYRYLGVSTAKAVEASGLCYEEYLMNTVKAAE